MIYSYNGILHDNKENELLHINNDFTDLTLTEKSQKESTYCVIPFM